MCTAARRLIGTDCTGLLSGSLGAIFQPL